jgi:hypothetical protein
MSLAPGTSLGPYKIVGAIGAGGMGEVYRAHDARLDREVAIKVLPAAFADDADRRARFEREARAIAALSHPNILAIFDTGETTSGVSSDGDSTESRPSRSLYVVTELLAGETLRERLITGALPVKKATDIAVQIARGLAAAHDKGVVHRDLKPENVFLLRDGQVKILDFGLARHAPSSSGATETTAALTDPGVVMGTVGYMAPEQVRGQHVDVRADLFALGAVLYEILSGRRAFQRDTAAETLTAILREDPPDFGGSSASLPPALDRIVRHCLEKSPAERFQTARDVAFALEALSGSGAATVLATAPGRTRPWAMRWGLPAAAGLLLVWLGFAARGYWTSRPSGLPVSWEGELLGGPIAGLNLRVSPKDQEIAFAALIGKQTQVGLMRLASGDWMPLTSDPSRGNVQDFAWSPDSARLYFDRFQAGGQPSIFWMSPLGGQETLFLEDAFSPRSLPDGSLLVGRYNSSGQRQIYRRWPEGERLESLGALGAAGESLMAFRVFKKSKAAVFFGRPESDPSAPDHLYVIDLDSGAWRALAPGIEIKSRPWLFPLAVSPDDAWVLFDMLGGDLHHIVAVRSDGSPGVHTLLTLTGEPLGLDVGSDWSLYVDQIRQPTEIRWYSQPGVPAASQRIPDSAAHAPVLPIDRGRVLVTMRSAGKTRVMVVEQGKDPASFIDAAEDTSSPLATLGRDRLLLIVGSGTARRVAVASMATGRIIDRIDGIDAGAVESLAGSPDGAMLFYAAEGVVWSKPTSGGKAEKVRDGHGVAVDPEGQYLVVKQREPKGTRLFRVPLPVGAGKEQEIPIAGGNLRLYEDWQSPKAIGAGGRLLVRAGSNHSWYYPAAILDPQTGRLEPVDRAFDRDMVGAAWSDDGQIVTQATSFESTLWRFRPRWESRD